MLLIRFKVVCALAAAFLVGGNFLEVQQAHAQRSPFGAIGRGESVTENPVAQLRQRLEQSISAGSTVALEGAVVPEEYLVGPGDVFTVSIGGPQPAAIPVVVTADGHLVLPDGEVILTSGRTLDTVREDALSTLRRGYRNVPVDISLAQPRQFYVHVAGAVPVPGRYLALPMSRVSDIVYLAYADTVNAPVSNSAYRPSLRNISITRRDGSTASVDLALYMSTGDTQANPFVRDGDAINVPAYRIHERALFVNGSVPFPGAYDFRPGDSLSELLRVAGIQEGLSGVGSVRLVRQNPDGTVTDTVYSVSSIIGDVNDISLQPLDNLIVQPSGRAIGTVEVEGYVTYPGRYPIELGRTTLRDLVQMAGGVSENGLVRAAYLVREVLPAPDVSALRQGRLENERRLRRALSADTVAILQYLRQSDLDFLSRTQFAQALRIQNRVSIDLEEVLAGQSPPILLKDGDRLVVPHDAKTVYVFGQVERPGFVPYQPGNTVSDYLALAGGRTSFAKSAYVVEAKTGAFLSSPSAPIRSGDLIFVDSRRDFADSAELQRLVLEENRARAQTRYQWIQVAAQTILAASSFLTVYLTLNR